MKNLTYEMATVKTKAITSMGFYKTRKLVTRSKVHTFEVKAHILPLKQGDAILKRKGNEVIVAIDGANCYWANKTKYYRALSGLYAKKQLKTKK